MKFWAYMPFLLLAGCASSPKNSPPKVEDKPPALAINLGPGNTVAYSESSKASPRVALWKLQWQSARVEANDKKQSIGEVSPATGELYKDTEPPAPFSADRGTGNQSKKVLTLIGNVKLESRFQKTILYCDELSYDASAKIVKAKGNVRVVSPSGTLVTDQELWATQDLSNVGTKDEFLRSRSAPPSRSSP